MLLMHLCAHKDCLYYWRSVVSGRSTYQTDEFHFSGAWYLILLLKNELKSAFSTNVYSYLRLNQSLHTPSNICTCFIPFPHQTVFSAAVPGAELFLSSCPRLFQLIAAENASVVLLTPDCMIQADKTGIPGKTMCFTILLYLVFIQIQRTAYHMIAYALHPHTEDFCFLGFGHTITSIVL